MESKPYLVVYTAANSLTTERSILYLCITTSAINGVGTFGITLDYSAVELGRTPIPALYSS